MVRRSKVDERVEDDEYGGDVNDDLLALAGLFA
jgi:hypothetical protein